VMPLSFNMARTMGGELVMMCARARSQDHIPEDDMVSHRREDVQRVVDLQVYNWEGGLNMTGKNSLGQ
jgi:hypothetical protein